jgi:predicted amino acid dehydrogenase
VGPDAWPRWRANREAGRGLPAELDVVLVTHPRDEHDVPRLFPETAVRSLEQRRAFTRDLKPVFGEVIETPQLNAGILFLPVFADEIMDPAARGRCRKILQDEGLPAVAAAGPRAVVCLGGLTGSLSAYGRKIESRANELGLTLTTGHSATAISVLRTWLRAVNDLNMVPAGETMTVIGLGSVGGAFVELLTRQDQLPRCLVLVDRPSRQEHVERLAERLRQQTRMQVVVEFTTSAGQIEPTSRAYRSNYLITAVSTPYLIDIGRLAPGTILIDDSQPYCWCRRQAWERCRQRRDIAPCEAGLVDCGSIGYRSFFDFDFADHGRLGSNTSWSCLAEGLLRSLQRDLPSTLGEPTPEHLLEYNFAFSEWGFETPPLQCGQHELPVEELREQFPIL